MSWQTDKIYHLLYRFLRLSATFGWTLADKLLMWQIYTNKESASKATLKALFEVLYSRDIRFTHFVLAEISRRYKTSAKPLVKGSKVAINGLIPLERRVLKALLKGATLTFHAQILPSTTHIICATLPAVDYTRLHTANLLTINDFFEFVNWEKSGYIAQADEAENRVMAENLSALFLSGQAENVALALELIANGGLPKQSLITPLFLVAKDDFFAPELRQRCRELLFSQASFELQAKMRYKIRLFRRYLHKKDERLRRIAAYAPYPELDIAIIEDYMRRRLGKYF